jgi:hypothetical protein
MTVAGGPRSAVAARATAADSARKAARDPASRRAAVRVAIRGLGAIEFLVSLPILLFVGLGALQFGLVFQAKHALNMALIEAARAGSVAHADPEAVRAGLARGLVPWLYGAADLGEYALNLVRARAHVTQGELLRWIELEQVSPTSASFGDWAEPARDANGGVIPGMREIPNDNLSSRALRTPPAQGTAGDRSGAPIGRLSGQTLADANLLQLRLDYGVPLAVPVVGRLLAWTLRAWDGCALPAPRRYGLLGLDAPLPRTLPRWRSCAMYGVGDGARPRLPVRVTATIRMQSPARHAGASVVPD